MELPACLKGCTCERETFHDCRSQFEFHRPPSKARMLNNPSLHINKLVSDPRGKSFDCRVCERVFKTEELLEKHIRNHSENRPHKCPQCPKGFKQPSHLSQHLRTHTDERPFICNVCSKAFKQSCQLKQHMRLHTGEKPYKCPECDRGFKQASQLNQHFRLHTGEKPYKCMICYKAFTQASQLRSHKKTHEPKPERKASSYKTKSHQVPNVSLSQSLPNTFQPTQVTERGLYYSSTRLGSSFSLKDLELPTDDSIHVVQLPMTHHLGMPPFST